METESYWYWTCQPGARPTNDISIEFQIRPKFGVLYIEIFLNDHNDISARYTVVTCWKCRCDRVQISLWSVEHILN